MPFGDARIYWWGGLSLVGAMGGGRMIGPGGMGGMGGWGRFWSVWWTGDGESWSWEVKRLRTFERVGGGVGSSLGEAQGAADRCVLVWNREESGERLSLVAGQASARERGERDRDVKRLPTPAPEGSILHPWKFAR